MLVAAEVHFQLQIEFILFRLEVLVFPNAFVDWKSKCPLFFLFLSDAETDMVRQPITFTLKGNALGVRASQQLHISCTDMCA